MRQRSLRAALGLVLVTGLAVTLLPATALAVPPSCDDPNPPPLCYEDPDPPVSHDPSGTVVNTRRVPGGVWVTGYAYDIDGGGLTVTLKIGATPVATMIADLPEPEMGSAGFEGVIPAIRGAQVCGTAHNVGPGQDADLTCDGAYIPFDPYGSLDDVVPQGTQVMFDGWAIDPDTANPVQVDIHQDGQLATTVTADRTRTDVGAANWRYGDAHGFEATVPERPTDGTHTLCATARHITGTGGAENDVQLGCKTYTVTHNPSGTLDEVTRTGNTVRVRGAVTDPDEPSAATAVHLYHDGAFLTEIASANHAYDTTIAATMASGPHTVCAYGINRGPGTVNTQLGCKTYSLPAPVTAPAPTIDTAGSDSDELALRWNKNHPNTTGWRLEQSASGGPWTVVKTLGAAAYSSSVKPLTPWTDYCFRVVALNEISEASGEVCGRTLRTRLPASSEWSYPAATDTGVTIRFLDNADAETEYYVDVFDVAAGNWLRYTMPGTPGTGYRTFTATGLKPNTKYSVGARPHHPEHEDYGQGGGVFVYTTGLPTITRFTADPAAIQACAPASVQLTADVANAHRIVVKRGGATLLDKTVTGTGTWHETVGGGLHDGNTGYTLTAYTADGRTVGSSLTVARASAQPLMKRLEYTNPSMRTYDLYYYSLDGRLLDYLGTVEPAKKLTVTPEHCVFRRIVAVDYWDGRVMWDSGVVLGHSDGYVFDEQGRRIG